jgi:hypothetical protein
MANPPGALGAVAVFVIDVGACLERRQNLAVTGRQGLIARLLPGLADPDAEQRAVARVAFHELTSAGTAVATLPITPVSTPPDAPLGPPPPPTPAPPRGAASVN